MNFSPYNSDRADEIIQLFVDTFSDSEGMDEGERIGQLVRHLMSTTATNDLYGFMASEDGQITGSIFFSRMRFEREISAFILSPVAVHTGHQRKGVGQRLIRFGLDALSTNGVELVLTYGDPAFYCKTGFRPVCEDVIPAPLPLTCPEGWLAQSFAGEPIEPIPGKSYCVDALNNPAYW